MAKGLHLYPCRGKKPMHVGKFPGKAQKRGLPSVFVPYWLPFPPLATLRSTTRGEKPDRPGNNPGSVWFVLLYGTRPYSILPSLPNKLQCSQRVAGTQHTNFRSKQKQTKK